MESDGMYGLRNRRKKKNERERTRTTCRDKRMRKRRSKRKLTTSNVEIKHTRKTKRNQTNEQKNSFSSISKYSFVTILERRTISNDASVNPSCNSDITTVSNLTHSMAMSASSHPSSNPSLFAYRNTITANSTVRQRAIAETTTTSLFITTEKLKSNTSSAMRPARQSSTATTAAVATAAMSSVYLPAQTQAPQRTIIHNIKPRIPHEKSTNSKGIVTFQRISPYSYQIPKGFKINLLLTLMQNSSSSSENENKKLIEYSHLRFLDIDYFEIIFFDLLLDLFEYPDPFTNCPPDLLSKLAQLTRLQLETVEWEKKRRYIKKKPMTNSTNHGKDSP